MRSSGNGSKRKARKRVSKALTKYVRGQALRKVVRGNPSSMPRHRFFVEGAEGNTSYPVYNLKLSIAKKRAQSLANKKGIPVRVFREFSDGGQSLETTVVPKARRSNPANAVKLRNFTGTVIRLSNGQVLVNGKGRRPSFP